MINAPRNGKFDNFDPQTNKRTNFLNMNFFDFFFQLLGYSHYSQPKWSVESVHSKNLVSILHLLVALARQFRAPIRLPENVSVFVVVVQVSPTYKRMFSLTSSPQFDKKFHCLKVCLVAVAHTGGKLESLRNPLWQTACSE